MIPTPGLGGSTRWPDAVFRAAAVTCAALVCLLMLGFFVELTRNSMPSIREFGFGFLTSATWNPVTGNFGALSSIYGTLVSTAIALLLAVPLSLATALFLVKLAPPGLARWVRQGVELLAAIPSIIYGMWGLFVFAPYMAEHVQPALKDVLGFTPLFGGPAMGIGMLTAGIILALMVLPFTTAVMRDVFRMTPEVLEEAAYGMGSTTWEVVRRVTIPHSIRGLAGGVFLGLGRAIGETMAVTFVIGNDHQLSASLLAAGNSIASTLANEFTEASEPLYRSSLIELGLVLLVITFLIQVAAHLWLQRLGRSSGRTA
ncbi:MAG TPA: phosphate ABC transporter permease subunit PstC [Gemmatimonadota bacterium]|nr:phosphate ABC transporter permease subunit PstC [Gemmatimonadota bacterium]